MIEIVLRKDIRHYEPKPFFGLTARQLASIVAVIGVSIGSYVLLSVVLGLPTTFAGWIVMALGGTVGFIGLGKVNGLKPEEWLKLRKLEASQPQTMIYQRPFFERAEAAPAPLTKADKVALKDEIRNGEKGATKKQRKRK